MEVGDQRVDGAETVAGIDKDPGVALGRADEPVFVGDALQHAAGGRPDGDDAPARSAAAVDLVGGGLVDVKMLGVHQVIGDPLFLHGTEGAQPDVKGHFGVADPLLSDRVEQFGREVQSRGRRGGGALLLRVDRLIAREVVLLFVNVRGEGKFPDRVEQFVVACKAFAVVVERYDAVPVVKHRFDRRAEQSVPEEQDGARLRPFAGTNQRFPAPLADFFQKQEFHRSARFFGHAEQPGGDHLRRVDDQNILRVEKVDDLGENVMLGRVLFAVEHHQARAVAPLGGRLRDQFLGQIVVEIRGEKPGRDLLVQNDCVWHRVPLSLEETYNTRETK